MNKNRKITKTLYSNSSNGINTQIQIEYNIYTEHIGIYTSFKKSKGWNNGSVNNKNCPNYLGITIAEQLLAKIFKNVEVMPYGNRGFDFKCNHGYMIDVKSSVKMKTRNTWSFHINHNLIADYFLCLAFDNRQQLNPLHVWLIPSKLINHLKGFGISKSRFYKWNKYELTDKLDKVIGYCNIMKEK